MVFFLVPVYFCFVFVLTTDTSYAIRACVCAFSSTHRTSCLMLDMVSALQNRRFMHNLSLSESSLGHVIIGFALV